MNAFIEQLLAAKPVLTDGGWGTEFQSRGLEPGLPSDAWNLEHPQRVEEVARAYVDAGSRVILTNTFNANPLALERHGLGARSREINAAGVEISRRAAQGRAAVFASLGPCGKLLASGEVTEEVLQQAFAEQAQALAAARPDAVVVETMSDLREATLAVQAVRAAGLPVIACMAFDSGREKTRTMMGTTLQDAAKTLTAAGADAVGANCGQGVENYLQLYQGLAAATHLPVWIKPNAGSPEWVDGRTVYRTTAETFAQAAAALASAGAAFIGGCCGTTPQFIRTLGDILRAETGRTPCA